MLGLCVEYFSSAVVGPSFSAYIAEQSSESGRGRAFGLTQSIYMIVTVIGPATAGFLAYRFSFRLMLAVALVSYAILASLLAGWLTDRLGKRLVIVAGFAVEALGLVILLQAGDFPAFLIAMFTFGLGAGSLMPAYHSLISKAVPEDRRGLAYGFFGTSLGILSLPFPWVGAQLWKRFGPQTPFLFTVAACLISMPIAWFKFILPQKEAESAL